MRLFLGLYFILISITCGCWETSPKTVKQIVIETTPSLVFVSFEVDKKQVKNIDFGELDDSLLVTVTRIWDEHSSIEKVFGEIFSFPIGSGFIISTTGVILTCAHVVEFAKGMPGKLYIKLSNGKKYLIDDIKIHKTEDLAILKINPGEDKLKKLHLEIKRKIDRTDDVIFFGTSHPVYFGFIMGKIVWPEQVTKYKNSTIQEKSETILTPVSGYVIPGFSGGPVVNMYGKVVGMTTSHHVYGAFSFLMLTEKIVNLSIELLEPSNTKQPDAGRSDAGWQKN